MKRAPGAPLAVGVVFEEKEQRLLTARLAIAAGVAQLEWKPQVLVARLPVDPLLYPPDPGLHAARGRVFEGLHGSWPTACGRGGAGPLIAAMRA